MHHRSPLLVARLDLGVLEGAGPDEEGGEERGVVHVGHDGLAAVVPANRWLAYLSSIVS